MTKLFFKNINTKILYNRFYLDKIFLFLIKNLIELINRGNMLVIDKFSKKYKGAEAYSAKDISFTVHDGEIVGLVGSNGAGKSTLIKSITGVLPFEEGKIILDDIDIKENPVKAKKLIGYAPDDHTVYDKLTGREYVDYMGSIYGVKKKEKQEVLEKLSKRIFIDHALDNQIGSYSHGMKQKICLIGSVIHTPKLWVLDEPTVGLDPQTMEELMVMIKEHASKGNCVLFSSHNLNVVKKNCDKVVFIVKGRVASIINMHRPDIDRIDFDSYFWKINGIEK